MMPGMDGWAVLSALKKDAELADIPVIMCTILDDRNLGFALGATDFLTKPIDHHQLATLLRKYGGVHATGEALIVEDDPDARDTMSRMLKHAGWNVVEAENGRIALKLVTARAPQLILLDLMMPEMDGFEFVQELRKSETWRSIPVIVITAKDLTAQERSRLSGHVQAILQKGGYSRQELLREIRDLAARLPRGEERITS
jgi:CheY-like chemotaxis protein